jgi:hypothetical protein
MATRFKTFELREAAAGSGAEAAFTFDGAVVSFLGADYAVDTVRIDPPAEHAARIEPTGPYEGTLRIDKDES